MAGHAKAFWSCKINDHWPSSLNLCEIMLEVFGVIANAIITGLMFRLRAEKTVDLALLRVLSFSCLASTLIDLLHAVTPPSPNTGNAYFDGLVCIFWNSRFLYWYSKVHAYHALLFFACNRACEIVQIRYYFLATEKRRCVAYLLAVFIASFLAAAPQLLLAQPQLPNCACVPIPDDFAILTVIYTYSFLRLAFLAAIYPAILVYICVGLLLRLRNTGGLVDDDLDQLTFLQPSTQTTPCTDRSDLCGWSASYCIIPLTAAYVATFAFDAIYHLLGAIGIVFYELQSPAQTFSEVLIDLFTALVPLILFFHISAMRSLTFVAIASIKEKCSTNVSATSVAKHEVPD